MSVPRTMVDHNLNASPCPPSIAHTRSYSPKIVLLVMKGTAQGFNIAATAAKDLINGLLEVEPSLFWSS